jgi:hypothetical protein
MSPETQTTSQQEDTITIDKAGQQKQQTNSSEAVEDRQQFNTINNMDFSEEQDDDDKSYIDTDQNSAQSEDEDIESENEDMENADTVDELVKDQQQYLQAVGKQYQHPQPESGQQLTTGMQMNYSPIDPQGDQ